MFYSFDKHRKYSSDIEMLSSHLISASSTLTCSSLRRPLIAVSTRGVRSRRNAVEGTPPAGNRPGEPVQWLQDATTYADAHSVVLDPTTKLPYQEKDMKEMMERTARDAIREKNKMKFSKKAAISKLSFDHIPLQDQVVLLFPGQGAQFVGMGKQLSDCPQSLQLFERASSILGYDLYELCTKGPKSKLDQTLFCQPAVVVAGLAAYEKLQQQEPDIAENCTDAAGFSVGEFSALVAGGVIGFDDAIRLVAARASAMHECAQLIRSGMATVRVAAASQLDKAMSHARKKAEEEGEMQVCEVANHLYCGVKVIGASETCMRFLEENANTYKFQFVKRLEVSGAFHTRQMEGAVEKLREAMRQVELNPAVLNVYSNYTGQVHGAKKAEIRGALSKQVTSPVKWEQIQQLLYRKHKDEVFPRFIECGPGRQLGAMLYATSKKAHAHYENVKV